MKIATAIFTQDCQDWRLKASLECNLRQERMPDEILVIDFGSSQENLKTYRELADRERVRLIEIKDNTELFHPSRMANKAVKETSADILCFTGVDELPDKTIYQEIESAFRENPYRVVMCARYDLPPESNNPEIDFAKDFNKWLESDPEYHPAPGSFQCLPVIWLKEVGGFNEKLIGWGGYDEDIKRRAKRAGFREHWLETKLLHIHHEKRPYTGKTDIGLNSRTVTNFRGVKLLPNGEEDKR